MGKFNLPDGCCYPDCFDCPLPDCGLPDNEDVLGDVETLLLIDKLTAEREKLKEKLKEKGIKTRKSKKYCKLSSRIAYLENRDLIMLKAKESRENAKYRSIRK